MRSIWLNNTQRLELIERWFTVLEIFPKSKIHTALSTKILWIFFIILWCFFAIPFKTELERNYFIIIISVIVIIYLFIQHIRNNVAPAYKYRYIILSKNQVYSKNCSLFQTVALSEATKKNTKKVSWIRSKSLRRIKIPDSVYQTYKETTIDARKNELFILNTFLNIFFFVIILFYDTFLLSKTQKIHKKIQWLLKNIDRSSDATDILFQKIKKQTIEMNSGKYEIRSYNKNIKKISQKISKSLQFFNKLEILLVKVNMIDFIDKKVFQNWTRKKFIFPLEQLQAILKKEIHKIENLKKEQQNSTNEHIQLAFSRIEIQKNNIQKQIRLLHTKISSL